MSKVSQPTPGELWRAREAMAAALTPVWPPLAAPLEWVDRDVPDSVSFGLRFYRWQIKLTLAPYGPPNPPTTDLRLAASIRPASLLGRTLHGLMGQDWETFMFKRLGVPVDAEVVEDALLHVKQSLWERPEINAFLNELYLHR